MSMTPEDLQDDPSGLRAFAEKSATEAREAQAKLAEMERREAFRDAGLNPTDPLHQAVINGYTGEIGEVKSFVDGLGLNKPVETPEIPQAEQEALTRIAGMPAGDGFAAPNESASGDDRLRAIVDQARREGWAPNEFNARFSAEMIAQRRPVNQGQMTGA